MSSCRPRSYVSGPLVTGHTKSSSSFGSTELLLDERDERWIDDRGDGQRPAAVIGKRRAFYRILLRHQDRRRAWKLEVPRRIPVVVGEFVNCRTDAERAQLHEKARRRTDARERVDAGPCEGRGVGCDRRLIHPD